MREPVLPLCSCYGSETPANTVHSFLPLVTISESSPAGLLIISWQDFVESFFLECRAVCLFYVRVISHLDLTFWLATLTCIPLENETHKQSPRKRKNPARVARGGRGQCGVCRKQEKRVSVNHAPCGERPCARGATDEPLAAVDSAPPPPPRSLSPHVMNVVTAVVIVLCLRHLPGA